MRRLQKLLTWTPLLIATTALLLVTATATAQRADRNGDGIPDRWAKKYGMNPRSDQADRDQDRDKVRNICEFEARTSPRKANSDRDRVRDGREDTDRDGIVNFVESIIESDCGYADSDGDGLKDGSEVAGVIDDFDGELLSVRLSNGSLLNARVDERTYVYCEEGDFVDHSDDESESFPGASDDDETFEASSETDFSDGAIDMGYNCGIEDLDGGSPIAKYSGTGGYFTKVVLIY